METVHVGPAPRIALTVHGSGPLVVFLHGIGGNRHHWNEQLPVFATRSGWRRAKLRAMRPPMESPTRCAFWALK